MARFGSGLKASWRLPAPCGRGRFWPGPELIEAGDQAGHLGKVLAAAQV
jgi:hypothetical protein